MEISPLEARALVALGRFDEARARIESGRTIADGAVSDEFHPRLLREEARLLARQGDARGALERLDEAIARLDRAELALLAAAVRLDRARLLHATGDTAGARAGAEESARRLEACGAMPNAKKAREFLASL
jgi:hypothetical protein